MVSNDGHAYCCGRDIIKENKMSLTATKGASIDPIENGNHQGVCVAVIDLGTQYNKQFNKSQPKVMITWELPDFPILNENGQPDPSKGFRLISREYTAILHEKSNLYIDLISWRGVAFTPEEMEGFNIKAILGVNCLVNVIRVTKNNNTYANVTAVAKLPKGMAPKTATYQLLYDMDEGVVPIPEGVADWIKTKIEASEEFIAQQGGQQPPQSERQPPVGDDSDIPF